MDNISSLRRILVLTSGNDPSGMRLFEEVSRRIEGNAHQFSETSALDTLLEEMQRSTLVFVVVNAAYPFHVMTGDCMRRFLEGAASNAIPVTWIGVGDLPAADIGPLNTILPVRWSPIHYQNLSAEPSDGEISAVAEEVVDLWREKAQQGAVTSEINEGQGDEVIRHVQQMGPSETTLDLTRRVGTTFPREITEYKWLERLYLYRGQLENVPASIGALKNLRELSIARNQIRDLPQELGELQNLNILYLDHNLLRELPQSIGRLAKLEQLHLFQNQLETIPDLSGLKNLHWLTLDQNKFVKLPPAVCQLRSVRVLSLTDNRLTVLPREIAKMENLEELYLRGNPIQRLPAELGLLPHLRVLDLDFEKLQFPPPALVVKGANEHAFRNRELLEYRTSRILRFLRICERIDPLHLAFQSVLSNRSSVDLLPIPDVSRFRMQEVDWLDFAEDTLEEGDRTHPNPLWLAWMRASHTQALQTVTSQIRP